MGVSWGPLGGILGPLGTLLGVSWGVLGAGSSFSAVLGRTWRVLGASLGPLGGVLGPSWAVLAASWGPLGASWRPLGDLLGASCSLAPMSPEASRCKGQRRPLKTFFGPFQTSVAKIGVRRAFWQFTFVKRDSFVKLDVSMAAWGQGEQNWRTSRTESTCLLCSESSLSAV